MSKKNTTNQTNPDRNKKPSCATPADLTEIKARLAKVNKDWNSVNAGACIDDIATLIEALESAEKAKGRLRDKIDKGVQLLEKTVKLLNKKNKIIQHLIEGVEEIASDTEREIANRSGHPNIGKKGCLSRLILLLNTTRVLVKTRVLKDKKASE